MSDCFSRGLACNSAHTCNQRGCQRKRGGFDPVDRPAVEDQRNRSAQAARMAIMQLSDAEFQSRDIVTHAVMMAIQHA